MIVRKVLDWRIIVRIAWKRMLSLAIVSTTVAIVYRVYGADVSISTLPASILGIAIAFLIGFRVNSAYERWWEARKIWGAIVNDSRTFARQVLTMVNTSFRPEASSQEVTGLQKQLIYGQIGFVWALNWNLRKNPVQMNTDASVFFSNEEWLALSTSANVPNAILTLLGQKLEETRQKGLTEDFRHMQMDNTLSRLTESMGMAERIKNTVFPRQYSYYSTLFTKVYSYMLPFVLVPDTGFWVILFTCLIGFVFFALDSIANGIDNPFNNSLNDTPMTAISRTIEINLREMLGEQSLPEPVQDVNGFLY